jgi:hypothetical protein
MDGCMSANPSGKYKAEVANVLINMPEKFLLIPRRKERGRRFDEA